MSRLCWVFVLLLDVLIPVAVIPSDARTYKCEQIERSLADLDLADYALNKAKQLYPNCGEDEEENGSPNSSECSTRNKLLGLIDVALDLISNAKTNIPHCTEVTTKKPLPTVTTKAPTTMDNIRAADCQQLQAAGAVTSGVYNVFPRFSMTAVRVRCDMDTDGGGWTVIQRRGNFSQQENFYRVWTDYKIGFGDLERDFWLGNDHIFALTSQGIYALRMDMKAANGDSGYAVYREFRIEDENSNYRLHVGGYTGNTGDDMTYSKNEMFSTKDRKNDSYPRNCTEERKGGFWYSGCAMCNPNGLYQPGVDALSSMYYFSFKKYVGLSSIDMKIKRLS